MGRRVRTFSRLSLRSRIQTKSARREWRALFCLCGTQAAGACEHASGVRTLLANITTRGGNISQPHRQSHAPRATVYLDIDRFPNLMFV